MLLVPFDEQDVPTLRRWITSPRDNFLWGGPAFDFPLTESAIAAHIAKPQVTPYLVTQNGEAMGYIDLYRVSRREVRLCRVLIAEPALRGQGLGKQLVALALAAAREDAKVANVSLAVFAQNQAAIGCYTALGFEPVPEETKIREFEDEHWTLFRMKKQLS